MSIKELISAEVIAERIGWMGTAISQDFRGKPLTVVPVLKGSFVFAADLVRVLRLDDLLIDFVGVSSYGSGTESTGNVKVTHDLTQPVAGRHVLLVEDIVDSGLTLSYLLEDMKSRGAESVSICAFLDKPARRRVQVPVAYYGFTVEDKFVVGYGLDAAGKFRNLPYVGCIE